MLSLTGSHRESTFLQPFGHAYGGSFCRLPTIREVLLPGLPLVIVRVKHTCTDISVDPEVNVLGCSLHFAQFANCDLWCESCGLISGTRGWVIGFAYCGLVVEIQPLSC